MSTTVVVVTYNSERTLARCLESVLDDPAIEVLVVDNGSTDCTLSLVRDRFSSARLLELDENRGFGAANNRAERVARGERLLLLNPDAWLDPGALPLLEATLDASPGLAAVAPQLRYPDGRLQCTWYPETGVLGEAIQRWRNLLSGRWAHGWLEPAARLIVGPGWLTAACLLLRREAFRQAGGFDEDFFLYFEDVDLCRRLSQLGWRLAKEPAAGAVHVVSVGMRSEEESESISRAALEYRRSQLRYYRKHRPPWEWRFLRRLLTRRCVASGVAPGLREGLRAALREDLAASSEESERTP
jgi:GT2 family glycosyltransferase